MLKSTHKSVEIPPLPPGWTEHKAPTDQGHSYYYNTETKQSTYKRPAPPPITFGQSPIVPLTPSQSFLQYSAVGQPDAAGATSLTDRGAGQAHGPNGNFTRPRSQVGPRPDRPQPKDKPKSSHPIPGCEPWILVYTKYGRRFVYNKEKDQSFWRIPEKLKDGILAVDQQRIKDKAEALAKQKTPPPTDASPDLAVHESEGHDEAVERLDSDYEEVEVTDDEADGDEGHINKRPRTNSSHEDVPLEFNEDDIAYQLAAMGQEYGLDPGEYDDGHMEYEPGAEGLELSEEDAAALFKDLLNDAGVNPYSPWEKLIEAETLVNDTRYTALSTTKRRKEVWQEWTRDKIKILREQRAAEEKRDPRIPYLAFLQGHATPKLYWPEFKRKYKKEPAMRDGALADKDREKLYRDHINRLKLPPSTLKSDLTHLLKSQPLSILNRTTSATSLPSTVLLDLHYISVEPAIRDPLVEAYLQTLGPPPDATAEDVSGEALRERAERERRNQALEDRQRQVAEEKQRQERLLRQGKARLREEEAEIERAMDVGKAGLRKHIVKES